MKIGVIGLGVVGGAVKHGLEKIDQKVVGFDIKFPETSIKDVIDTELCFICVPTPQKEDGTCDTSIVEDVLRQLETEKYEGLAVIKSTVIPGTTDSLKEKFKLRLAFCPEFLRERAAFTDFVENHDLCVIGSYNDSDYELIRNAHGKLPKNFCNLSIKEAEFAKYFSNILNALRIVFANEFHAVCAKVGVDYTKIKNAMVLRDTINDVYLDCNDNFRGFGGMCLPKDTAAFAAFVKQLGLDLKLFDVVVEENKKFKKTVPDGMRK